MKKLLVLFFLLMVALAGFGQTRPNVYQLQSITALSGIESLPTARRYMISSTVTATTNATFPVDIELEFLPGGKIVVPTGITVALGGAIIAGNTQIFSGAGKIIFNKCRNITVNPCWWGATPGSGSSSSDAIQSCIDSIVASIGDTASYRPTIQFPVGEFLISTPINLGGGRQNLHLRGSGKDANFGTVLVGATGDKTPIIDIVGGHGITVENFYLYCDTSTIAILTGYATICDAREMVLRNIEINAPDAISSNDGLGTIGIFNKSAENATYENLTVYANLPIILSTTADCSSVEGYAPSNFVATSSFSTFDTMTCGVHSFVGHSILGARGGYRPIMHIDNASCIDLGTLYMQYADVVGTYSRAISSPRAILQMSGNLNLENTDSLFSCREMRSCNISAQLSSGVASFTTTPIFNFDYAAGGIFGSDFKIYANSSPEMGVASAAKLWFAFNDSTTRISGSDFNSTNYLDVFTFDDYTPYFHTSHSKTTTFSNYSELDRYDGITMSGQTILPAVSSGTFSAIPVFYIIAGPHITSAGSSLFTANIMLSGDDGSDSSTLLLSGSCALARDSSGIATPTPYIQLASTLAGVNTDSSVLTLTDGAVNVVPNGSNGWYVQLSSAKFAGTASGTTPLKITWTANLKNTGYGTQGPSLSSYAP